MINESFGVVTEPEAELRAGGSRRGNGATRGDAHRSQPRDQPARAGRTHGTGREEILKCPRGPPKHPGPRDEPAHEAWAHDVKRGAGDGAQEPPGRAGERRLVRRGRERVNARGPRDKPDLPASLADQGRRFDRALPAAPDPDPLT